MSATGAVQEPRAYMRSSSFRRAPQPSEHRFILLLGDGAAALAAVALALVFWSITAGFPLTTTFLVERWYWVAVAPVWIWLLAPGRRLQAAFSIPASAVSIGRAAFLVLVAYLGVYFYAQRQELPRLVVLHFLWEASILTSAWRLAYIWLFTETSFRRRVLIAGTGKAGLRILDVIRCSGFRHAEIVGFVSNESAGSHADGVPVVGRLEDVRRVAAEVAASEVVLATDEQPSAVLLQGLLQCQESGIDVIRMPLLYEQLLERVPVEHIDPDWLVTSFTDVVRTKDASRAGKRLVDLGGAVVGTFALLFVAPFVATAVWLDDGSPVFFRQTRVGRAGRHFTLLKFRTMQVEAERAGRAVWASRDDPRVTRVGRWLRKMRLDELPQFLNVLRGDMSLVGPRPERPEFVSLLDREVPFYRMRLLVRPGLTGWAQVNMPYADSVTGALVKLEYDLYYIKHRSMAFDAMILFKTLGTLLGMAGR